MRLPFLLMPLLFLVPNHSRLYAQQHLITGRVLDAQRLEPVAGITLGEATLPDQARTDADGRFFLVINKDSLLLSLSGRGYGTLLYPLGPGLPDTLELGVLHMRPETDPLTEQEVVTLHESLPEEDDFETGMPLLQAGRDLFLSRAAFDFSAGFFRPRGLDTRESEVFLNGVPMNRAYDGRTAWSTWGGLTDIGRHSEQNYGLGVSGSAFGGLLGATEILAAPSVLRPGIRLTASLGNRSYQVRQMATYNSGMNQKGLGMLLSLSNRLATSGYVDGTPFSSQAGYAALEWHPNKKISLLLAGVVSHTSRGSGAPLTEELAGLGGNRYNPNWGWHQGQLRSARVRTESEPLLMFLFTSHSRRLQWNLSGGFQWGSRVRSRLASIDAPNPDPAYYRNLPSFYYNSPLGANYQNTNLSAASFRAAPQLNWANLYHANRTGSGKAAYLLQGDAEVGQRWHLRATARYRFAKAITLQAALRYSAERLAYYGRLLDLLGASYHIDKDPFSDTSNDLDGPSQKGTGDRIGYAFNLQAQLWEALIQMGWERGRWDAAASFRAGVSQAGRTGYFRNERYPVEGQGPRYPVLNRVIGIKARLGYRISGQQWLYAHFTQAARPPLLRDVYADSRENNRLFPLDGPETATGGSLDLLLRHPWLKGRLSAYYLRLAGGRSLRSYYAETAFGAAFVREATGGIATLHRGLEAGVELPLNPSLSFTLAGAAGANTYSGNPRTWLYYFRENDAERLPAGGQLALGQPLLAGKHLARGPEVALSVGLSYRDPAYWWVDIRANYLANSYADLAVLRYTGSFGLQPETGLEDPAARPGLLEAIRSQRPLPAFYLLNLSAGKSWMRGRHYVSLFAGLNNVFDQISRTGGYQQGRLATFSGLTADNQSGHPSFGTRYWYGAGRTFFINISWSF